MKSSSASAIGLCLAFRRLKHGMQQRSHLLRWRLALDVILSISSQDHSPCAPSGSAKRSHSSYVFSNRTSAKVRTNRMSKENEVGNMTEKEIPGVLEYYEGRLRKVKDAGRSGW